MLRKQRSLPALGKFWQQPVGLGNLKGCLSQGQGQGPGSVTLGRDCSECTVFRLLVKVFIP